MGGLLTLSPLSLFLLPKYRLKYSTCERSFNTHHMSPPSAASFSRKSVSAPTCYSQTWLSCGINDRVISSSKAHNTIPAASAEKDSETLTDTGGDSGGDDFGSGSGSGKGGDGGGGNKGDGNDNSGKEEDEVNSNSKTPMSMSQKLTLGYAVLVGAGGVIGYLKSGSQTSIISGILSASLLYFVYTLLPTKPVIASALGFGLSFALLGVMGSRFKNSGKIFPAGIVSLVSLIMTGGYLHGFMRGAH